MSSPTDRRYLESHEWHKLDGDIVTIGVSQFAVDELTDVTYIEVNNSDGPIRAGEAFGEIESVKATSELYCGVDGRIVEINEQVIQNPALVNEDPYEKGWIIKVRIEDPSQFETLLLAEEYAGKHV